jgi:hypothetical protein
MAVSPDPLISFGTSAIRKYCYCQGDFARLSDTRSTICEMDGDLLSGGLPLHLDAAIIHA